jgi:hypothetical protein
MCSSDARFIKDDHYLGFVSSLEDMTVDQCREILYPFVAVMAPPFEIGDLFY